MATDVVAEFLNSYERNFDYYKATAELCASHCQTLLRQAGIKAIVTSRAKDVGRLGVKLQSRGKQYSSIAEIEDDIVDLAGVRIALYYPGDMDAVESVVSESLRCVVTKRFPDDSESRVGRRFTGYRAIHVRGMLKADCISDSRYSSAQIEIQIASLFMHAWAEVDHDLVYKTMQGTPSAEEIETIDELNGLTLASEIALERLQRLTVSRRERGNEPFSNVYAMSSYIYDFLAAKYSTTIRLLIADGLFEYLRFKGLNNPIALGRILQDAQVDPESSIVAQVGFHIAYGNFDEFVALSRAVSRAYNHEAIPEEPIEFDFQKTQREFARCWAAIQASIERRFGLRPLTVRKWEEAEIAIRDVVPAELIPPLKELAAAFQRLFFSHIGFSMDIGIVMSSLPRLIVLEDQISI